MHVSVAPLTFCTDETNTEIRSMSADNRATITDDELLQLMESADRPYTTAARLSEKVPVSRQAVGRRLKRLADNGVIERDKISGSGVLYLTSDGAE